MNLGLHTLTVHADGQVTLQHDTLRSGIVGSCLQLKMKNILEKREVGFFISRLPSNIRLQPPLVLCSPFLISLRLQQLLSTLLEKRLDIGRLHLVNSLIITIAKGIKFLALALICNHTSFRFQAAESFQVEVMRMESKAADDVIGIGVTPAVGQRRIIDRQQLNDLHTSGYSPVNQTPQVAKITHATTVFTT